MNGNGLQPRDPHLRRSRSNGAGEAAAGLWVLVVVGLLLVILLLSPVLELAFPWRAGPSLGTSIQNAGRVTAVTVARIIQSPNVFIGKTVTVSGEVRRMIGANAFSVGGEDFVEGEELLVVFDSGVMGERSQRSDGLPAEHDIVQATGLVRRFDLRTIEREIGVDLLDAQFARWSGRPVVLAHTLSVTVRVPEVPVDDVLAEPGRYTGRVVRVRGELGELMSDHAFTVVEDARRGRRGTIPGNLLVVVDEPLRALSLLQATGLLPARGSELEVTVTGTVRVPSAAALRQVLGYRLADALYQRGIGRAVLVARGVAIAADERGKQ